MGFTALRTTGPDGAFRFDRVPAANLGPVQVEASGYLHWPDSSSMARRQLGRIAAGSVVTLEARLVGGAAISGHIFGPDGEPVSGAQVVLVQISPSIGARQSATATSDGKVSYRIDAVDPGMTGLLLVVADGYVQPGYPANSREAVNQGTAPEEYLVAAPEEGKAVKDVTLAGAEPSPESPG